MAYLYTKPVPEQSETASTPESWETNFANSKAFTWWTAFRLKATREWKLIQRYIPRGSRVADMGSGPGHWVRLLSLHGYRAVGCDYSAGLIARARALYPDSEWIQTRIQSVPLPDASLDGIISWGVIEHEKAGPGEALREFHRLLAPGGHIIVTVPIDTPAARHAHDVFESGDGHPAFFQYLMSEEELGRHVADAGFEVLETGSLPSAHINHVAPKVAKRLRGIPYRAAMAGTFLLLSWMKRYRVMIYAVG
ncbi:MAG TPA: methyltransferase domain-containing protein, partial [Thermoanaerobaculia bacterium]|nr:methyltransferase domain-containing protein [Thermoanaerobaculia bacterium]